MKISNKISNIRNFALRRKESGAPPDEVYIESTTAEQIAEMKKRLAERTRDLQEAQTRLKGLKPEGAPGGEPPVGPHPPLQELTLDDVPAGDDDEVTFDTPTDGGSPVKVISVNGEDSPAPEVKAEAATKEELHLEDIAADAGDKDEIKNLFSQDDVEEHPLANLINFLPDVSVQELQDDIDEIKSIIKEWQQSR